MHIHIHTCTRVCLCAHTCVCVDACVCVRAYVRTCVRACVRACVCVLTCTCVSLSPYLSLFMCLCVYLHTYAYMYKRIYVGTFVCIASTHTFVCMTSSHNTRSHKHLCIYTGEFHGGNGSGRLASAVQNEKNLCVGRAALVRTWKTIKCSSFCFEQFGTRYIPADVGGCVRLATAVPPAHGGKIWPDCPSSPGFSFPCF